jgi:hypothetical protein
MPSYRPPELTLRASACARIRAAERYEAKAVRMRQEAAVFQAGWEEYVARRDAQKAAEANVAARVAS